MALHVNTATITTDTNDTGISATDWLTSDNALVFGGDITQTHGSGISLLGIWISGGSYGTGNGGKGVLLGSSTTFSGVGAWSFNGSGTQIPDGTYTIHITQGTGTGRPDLATHSLIVDTTAPTVATDSDAADNSVAENAVNGTAVGVTASSTDLHGVTYSLTADSSGGGFAVDATTGVITVADGTLLDYEAAHSHSITVSATDDAGNVSTSDFTIALTDVNDNAPVFSSGTTASEDENSDVSNVVYTAAATDVDTVGTIAYSLTGDDAALFTINASTGEVTFNTSPDYEAPADSNSDNAYQVTVHANDGIHDTTEDVTISVNDVNDNAPVFSSGTSASEDENTDVSNVVYTAAATDVDTVGTVAYSLSGDDAALFSIDAGTGEVKFLASPDHEAPADANSDNAYQVTVHANDGVNDTTQDVTISVNDLNDTAPVFSSGTSANEDENTDPSNVVYTAAATDADTVGTVSYSLSGDDAALFSIDSSTGEVKFLASPDYEAPADANSDNAYQVTVHANDGVNDTAQDVTISVNDLNDNAPVFSSGTGANEDENTGASNVVYTAAATDADTVGTISYSLSGDDAALFSIDSTSGEVKFLASPDHEAPADANSDNAYQVTVHANDGVNDTAQDVTISVNDLNDTAPVFSSGTSANEDENTDASNVVYTAAATDADTVGTISYSLSGDDAALFSINASTGAVRFHAAPDYEAPQDVNHDNAYQVTVHANDGVADVTQDVTINVDNVAGLTVSGGSGLIIGTNEEDNLTGDDGHNVIIGLAGDDTLDGAGGDDVITGRTGNDTMFGGTGNDILRGRAGYDTLNGGAGADRLTGGGGHDTFVFGPASDSTSGGYDTITDMDFTRDHIDLSFIVTGIDARHQGTLSVASFDTDLASKEDGTHLGANHAAVFTASAGDLAGEHFLIIDANGIAGFQAGQDLVIHLQDTANIGKMDVSDFV